VCIGSFDIFLFVHILFDAPQESAPIVEDPWTICVQQVIDAKQPRLFQTIPSSSWGLKYDEQAQVGSFEIVDCEKSPFLSSVHKSSTNSQNHNPEFMKVSTNFLNKTRLAVE